MLLTILFFQVSFSVFDYLTMPNFCRVPMQWTNQDEHQLKGRYKNDNTRFYITSLLLTTVCYWPSNFDYLLLTTNHHWPLCMFVSTGRKKTEEVFHEPADRSEFYSMADLTTPPVFFNPSGEHAEFIHKVNTYELTITLTHSELTHKVNTRWPKHCRYVLFGFRANMSQILPNMTPRI